MTPLWTILLGPHPNGTRAVVKTNNDVDVNDVLLGIEAGHVALAAYPRLTTAETQACVGYAREHMPPRWRGDAAGTGSRLVVGRTDLAKAFRAHVKAWDILREKPESEASALLLAVYAVECGFKSILMKNRNVRTTKDLNDEDFTHDLNVLSNGIMKEKLFQKSILLASNNETIMPARLHEALRYGHRLDPSSQRRAVGAIQFAISFIEENLR